MGKLIVLEDMRKKRCLEALLADIGMPSYCDECCDDFEDLLLARSLDDLPLFDGLELGASQHQPPTPPRAPALILPFIPPQTVTRRRASHRHKERG